MSALLALALGAAQPIPAPVIPWEASMIVNCGDASGTVFHIGDGRYITAAHVVTDGNCTILGLPARITHQDGELDIAELSGPFSPVKFDLDCRGFRVGRQYLATGFAGGKYRINIPLIHSVFARDPKAGNSMFIGADVIPGMSGGPVIGEDYRVAGIINQRWPSRARSVADTYLCKDSRHA